MYRNYISHPSRVWRNRHNYSLLHGINSLASLPIQVRVRHDRMSGGRAWRDRGHRGHARHSGDHRERRRCAGKTCREMTDRKKWLNHRVSRKQRLQLGVRRRCRGGRVGEIRLVKDDVSGDQNAARGEVKASVPLVVRGVPEEHDESSGAPDCE